MRILRLARSVVLAGHARCSMAMKTYGDEDLSYA